MKLPGREGCTGPLDNAIVLLLFCFRGVSCRHRQVGSDEQDLGRKTRRGRCPRGGIEGVSPSNEGRVPVPPSPCEDACGAVFARNRFSFVPLSTKRTRLPESRFGRPARTLVGNFEALLVASTPSPQLDNALEFSKKYLFSKPRHTEQNKYKKKTSWPKTLRTDERPESADNCPID